MEATPTLLMQRQPWKQRHTLDFQSALLVILSSSSLKLCKTFLVVRTPRTTKMVCCEGRIIKLTYVHPRPLMSTYDPRMMLMNSEKNRMSHCSTATNHLCVATCIIGAHWYLTVSAVYYVCSDSLKGHLLPPSAKLRKIHKKNMKRSRTADI